MVLCADGGPADPAAPNAFLQCDAEPISGWALCGRSHRAVRFGHFLISSINEEINAAPKRANLSCWLRCAQEATAAGASTRA